MRPGFLFSIRRGIVLPGLLALAALVGCDDPGSNSGSSMVETPTIRFVACADGLTVEDSVTGLLWERKTGEVGVAVVCRTSPEGCPDANNVNNAYQWSSQGSDPDGNAYWDFLATLNTAPGFAGRRDWRLPYISELQTILVGPGVLEPATNDPLAGANSTGQALTCTSDPCVGAGFAALGGPTFSAAYWSASTVADDTGVGLSAYFSSGSVLRLPKEFDSHVRAVRSGSCGP